MWVNTVLYDVSPSIIDSFTLDVTRATCISGHTLGNYENKCTKVILPQHTPCTYIGDESFAGGGKINKDLSDSERA